MKSMTKKFLSSILVLSITAIFSTPASAEIPDILRFEKITKGMHGQAFTVVDPSGEIESFDVDIIGTIDNGKGANKMIMAKANGKLVDDVGGILQGMSGSPVYIDNKLVGAVSAGIKDMSPFTFFITPIEDMLTIWNYPDNIQKQLDEEKRLAEQKKLEAEQKKAEEESKSKDESKDESQIEDEDAEKAVYFFSGFDQAGANFLENQLSPFGIKNFYAAASNSSSDSKTDSKIEPGSPIGVAVVYGDFSVGATGTVTAVDGDNVLAFGHQFLKVGNSNFFLTDVNVIGTISGVSNGMKISSVGNIIGRVNQDRSTGIAGVVGKFPNYVPITVRVHDNSSDKDDKYNAQIAYNEKLVPQLSAAIAYSSMTKTADYLGDKTATVKFTIHTNAVESGSIERTNMFYNVTDVGQLSIIELLKITDLICSDIENKNNISDVKVDVTINDGRKTANIISAVPSKTEVKPGETVKFLVTIQPYRGEKEVIPIEYTVPKNQMAGTLNLDIRGGALTPVTQAALLQQAGLIVADEEIKHTPQQIQEIIDSSRNNEIVIVPGASKEELSDKELKKRIKQVIKAQQEEAELEKKRPKITLLADTVEKPKQTKETRHETNFIIENVIHATLKVKR